MSGVIVLVIVVWIISAVVRSADKKRQERWKAEIEAEQRKRKQQQIEEQRKIRELAKEQNRHAKELAKHEAWLKKHDEEIRKLTSRMTTAEMKMNRYSGLLQSQIVEMNSLDARYGKVARELEEIESQPFVTKSEAEVMELRKEKEKLESKLKTLDNQMFSSKMNLKKATDIYNEMKIKISEVA